MGDSDNDQAGSDVSDYEDNVDVTVDLSKMTEKQRIKWEKSIKKWRLFVDFLFRHIAIVTFKCNCFEHEELTAFLIALEKAESLRGQMKLKKGEKVRIDSIRVMKESADLLMKENYFTEANRIRTFIDLVGRMRGLSTIAGGFYKALKKGKVSGLDKIKHYIDYWKGFCIRSFDYTQLAIENVDPMTFNDLEKRFISWPTVLRTSLNLAQNFLKKACDSTGMTLISDEPTVMLQHMQAAELVIAAKIEDMLFQRVVQESHAFSLGIVYIDIEINFAH